MAVWLWRFWVFSLLGWGLERLFAAVTHSPVQRRRCLLFAPLCPVYGFGMAAVLALPPSFLTGWRLYFWGALAATAVEYLYHWLGEAALGLRFWDYSRLPGNLRGRVCLPFSLAWGALLYPAVGLVGAVDALAERVPPALTWLLLLFFTADGVCSVWFLAVTHDLEALRRAHWRGR